MSDQEATGQAVMGSGEEMGIKAARGILGSLARRAAEGDEVTYLTISGERQAAVVPVAAARTRVQADQDAADLEEARAVAAAAVAEAAELRRQVSILRQRLTTATAATAEQERWWAGRYIDLWRELERLAHVAGYRLEAERLGTLAVTMTRAFAVVAGRLRPDRNGQVS